MRNCPKCNAPLLPTKDGKAAVCSSGFECGGILNIILSVTDKRVNAMNCHPGGDLPRDCLWGLDGDTLLALEKA